MIFDRDSQRELLAHEIGWVWAVYFSTHNEVTHYSLVHADGNFIGAALSASIARSDQAVGGRLHSLHYLLPPPANANTEGLQIQAQQKYLKFLEQECGEIHLDGLPADLEVGSRRLRLETLFVPLHLVPLVQDIDDPLVEGRRRNSKRTAVRSRRSRIESAQRDQDHSRLSVGQVLGRSQRIAVLGLPGGGKSTLLKRLATAYAFPERRDLINDELPANNWFPLFVRCRQLDALVRSPIMEILESISKRAEMTDDLSGSFKEVVRRALQNGAALILLDGLDEISSDADRACFVYQLRTFLATYPSAAVVLTSRERGFRIIAGALSAQCQQFKLDDLDPNGIKALTLRWHKEVVGDSIQVQAEAEKLADTICANDRLMELAANPLLLTTLLLVKRWVGQLPTKRAALYSKAIEVLLTTWNVEGYEPIDLDEAIPQLEYLAFQMMKSGIQTISARRLREVLTSARAELPEGARMCKAECRGIRRPSSIAE